MKPKWYTYFHRWDSRSVVFGASIQIDTEPALLVVLWIGFLFWDFNLAVGKEIG